MAYWKWILLMMLKFFNSVPCRLLSRTKSLVRFSWELAFETLFQSLMRDSDKFWNELVIWVIVLQSAEILFVVLLWVSVFVLNWFSANNPFVLCFDWQASFEHLQHYVVG